LCAALTIHRNLGVAVFLQDHQAIWKSYMEFLPLRNQEREIYTTETHHVIHLIDFKS